MSDEKDKIFDSIDDATIEFLTLIETNIEQNILLELSLGDGYYHLAKTRVLNGQANVSALQIPNEEASDIEPMVTVERTEDDKEFALNIAKPNSSRGDCGLVNPLKWFGLLVPQDLRLAQAKFQQACSLATQIINTRNKIDDVNANYKTLLGKLNDLDLNT